MKEAPGLLIIPESHYPGFKGKIGPIEHWKVGTMEMDDGLLWVVKDMVSGVCVVAASREEAEKEWLDLVVACRSDRAPIGKKQRFEILRRDAYTCQLCGATRDHGVMLVVDHKIPVFFNGGNEPHNLWALCEECNLGKQAQLLPEHIEAYFTALEKE